jgi:hypothetical protein
VGELRPGPTLALDHNLLYQVLADPAFYAAVPAFFFMRDQGLAACAQIAGRLADPARRPGDCATCGNLKELIRPLQRTFVAHLRKLHAEAPAACAPLVAYLAARRGYRPTPVVVYYRGDDGSVGSVRM